MSKLKYTYRYSLSARLEFVLFFILMLASIAVMVSASMSYGIDSAEVLLLCIGGISTLLFGYASFNTRHVWRGLEIEGTRIGPDLANEKGVDISQPYVVQTFGYLVSDATDRVGKYGGVRIVQGGHVVQYNPGRLLPRQPPPDLPEELWG